ncbi:TlpA family protein disulfide reductase, partial [Virgisporangium aurantiacum]|uniref:TlpA family protein disulfide reductase n=1 Tax=Virgisporangium aurantiacum TaxID=175570 RepID=UPI0019510A41
LDMLMTFAVLRRLREHSARLAELPDFNMNDGPGYSATFTGRPLPEFSVRAVDGTPVSTRTVAGARVLIAVLRVGCGPCHDQLPDFAAWARDTDAVALSLVTGPHRDAAEMIATLADVSTVVAGRAADALAETFAVTVFPTFLELDADGVVVRAETHLSRMTTAEAARH